MGDLEDNTCPECGTAQTSKGPFCDNCGFRLGRPEADGERSIARVPFRPQTTPLVDPDLEKTAVEAEKFDPETLLEVPFVDNADRETAVEGVKAVTRAEAEAHAKKSNNFIATTDAPTEKNPAITPGQLSGQHSGRLIAPALPTVEQAAVVPSAVKTSTDLPAVVVEADESASIVIETPEDRAASRIIWIGLWMATVVATAMVTEYLVRDNSPVEIGTPSLRKVSPTRVAVPAGKFRRGLNDELRANILTTCLRMSDDNSVCEQDTLLAGEFPEETVTLDKFAIDSLEVTVGEYGNCVESGQCEPIDWRECKVYTLQGLQTALRAPRTIQSPGVTATCVTRDEAATFCAWRTGRLPTHDEWERGARGSDGRVYPWGSIWNPEAANWGELDVAQMPVPGKIDGSHWVRAPGQYSSGASPAGLLDAAGNAAEWVADEPVAARGGSWTSNPFDLRVTNRLELEPNARRTDVGFRCAY